MPLGAAFFSPCTAAWVALFGVGALQAGERVLVSGASGAVGSIAVQLARAAGARVAAAVDADGAAMRCSAMTSSASVSMKAASRPRSTC